VTRLAASLALVTSLGVACSVPKEAGFPDVERAAAGRTGQRAVWNQGGDRDAEVARAVAALLARKLGPDEAVQIALLNNRSLQATYEDLAVAQADVVQAGLLSNPVFSGGLRLPLSGEGSILSLGVEQDFLGVLLLPARKGLAEAAFEVQKRRVAHEVVSFALEVRAAFYEHQGAAQIAALEAHILEAAEASAALAERQHEAGTMSELDLETERDARDEVRLAIARSRADVARARERLTRLLGLWGAQTEWAAEERLADLPAVEVPLGEVEALAIARRLDVAAAREEVGARAYALAVATDFRWVGGASLGAELEDERDGTYLGPTAAIELPLFDRKQAPIAIAEAELRRSRARLHALAVDVRSEVRVARARVEIARREAEHYRDHVIPRRERVVALEMERYNAMLGSIYDALRVKQREVDAYRGYIEAVRDYWIARAELDRAAGGRVDARPAGPAPGAPR
jgi:cobalt-zinc-cadmium efflux system outer membrane protein